MHVRVCVDVPVCVGGYTQVERPREWKKASSLPLRHLDPQVHNSEHV